MEVKLRDKSNLLKSQVNGKKIEKTMFNQNYWKNWKKMKLDLTFKGREKKEVRNRPEGVGVNRVEGSDRQYMGVELRMQLCKEIL